MEPITQGLLGAAVGQAGFGHRLGRRALVWGALVGMLPDLDVIAAPLHDGFGELLYHRGTTHSLWFGPVIGPLLGWGLWRWRDGASERRGAWLGLCTLALFTHPLLDGFTTYGTQLLAPFSRLRFAWNGVGIIDPFYSVILAAALLVGSLRPAPPRLMRGAAALALALSSAYLLYGVELNQRTERDVRAALAVEGVLDAEVRAYPTIFQPWLRRVVARTPNEVRVGLYTAFRPGEPFWQRFPAPPDDPRVDDLLGTWRGSLFRWFAMNEITWHVRTVPGGSVVEIEDLRYALPGYPPDRGLWGVRARYDSNGARTSLVQRYGRRRSGRVAPLLRSMWRATWGDFSALGAAPG